MRAALLLAFLAVTLWPPAFAAADAPEATARLHVHLVPEQLGRGTTIEFGFVLSGARGKGELPPPVTALSLLYPRGFGIITSGLGLASCTTDVLETRGPSGCPSRSLMGYGTATGAINVGGEVVDEEALTAVFMAPFDNGEIALLFSLTAYKPLLGEWTFDGRLLPASPPFGGVLAITVPLIESFPGGSDVALVRLRSTIGPLGITYYNHIHGKFVPYRPTGVVLPRHCPHGGFPFAARFTFADGGELTARTAVHCPRRLPYVRPRLLHRHHLRVRAGTALRMVRHQAQAMTMHMPDTHRAQRRRVI